LKSVCKLRFHGSSNGLLYLFCAGIPTELRFQPTVKSVIGKLSTEDTRTFLKGLTSFYTRYYEKDTGKESALWIYDQVQKSIQNSEYSGTARAKTYAHSILQPSVIAIIEGSDPTLKSQTVILGAHLDSINSHEGQTLDGPAPGADDDGSGSAVLFETFRAILQSNFIPKRTIEFQWYAGEEEGFFGSLDIAEAYSRDRVDIIGMLQFDCVGFFSGKQEVGVVTKKTDATLNALLRNIADAYLNFKWINLDDTCSFACSDHSSFIEFGYPASLVMEVDIDSSPHIHQDSDTVETLNFEQILEFTKIAVGFVIEVGEPGT